MANAFDPQGQARYYWLDTAPAAAIPTSTEIAAGVNLTPHILPDGVEGFSLEPGYTDATMLADTETQSVRGVSSKTNGAFTMRRGSDAADASNTVLAGLLTDVGTAGYVVWCPAGAPASGDLVDIFPSTLSAVLPQPAVAGQVARYKVSFTHPDTFSFNKVLVS